MRTVTYVVDINDETSFEQVGNCLKERYKIVDRDEDWSVTAIANSNVVSQLDMLQAAVATEDLSIILAVNESLDKHPAQPNNVMPCPAPHLHVMYNTDIKEAYIFVTDTWYNKEQLEDEGMEDLVPLLEVCHTT